MKKFLIMSFLVTSLISTSKTNQEIIENKKKIEMNIYEKFSADNHDTKTLVKLTQEIAKESLKEMDNNIKELNKNFDKKDKRDIKELGKFYEDYLFSNIKFSSEVFSRYGLDLDFLFSLSSTTASTSIESYNMNINTFAELKRDKNTLDENVDTIYSYLYYKGSPISKVAYTNISSFDLQNLLNEKYKELESLISKNSNPSVILEKYSTFKSDFVTYEKRYIELINSTKSFTPVEKEKMRNLPRYEQLMYMEFLIGELKQL